jgi:hypothetical protein
MFRMTLWGKHIFTRVSEARTNAKKIPSKEKSPRPKNPMGQILDLIGNAVAPVPTNTSKDGKKK